MSQYMGMIQRILDALTTRYLQLKERMETVEKRVSDNDTFTDKQFDEKDKKIVELEAKIAALDSKLALLSVRISGLEKPVFKPTIPHKPVPPLSPWNPTDPYGPGNPWKPAPNFPVWPQYPPVAPVDPPFIPVKPQIWCTKCGLNQDNAMGYCCARLDCPSKAVSTCTVKVNTSGGNSNT